MITIYIDLWIFLEFKIEKNISLHQGSEASVGSVFVYTQFQLFVPTALFHKSVLTDINSWEP